MDSRTERERGHFSGTVRFWNGTRLVAVLFLLIRQAATRRADGRHDAYSQEEELGTVNVSALTHLLTSTLFSVQCLTNNTRTV